jgi:hypothetical protein
MLRACCAERHRASVNDRRIIMSSWMRHMRRLKVTVTALVLAILAVAGIHAVSSYEFAGGRISIDQSS